MTESVKIVLLGDSGVGKTSIITRYINGKLPEVSKPTVGAAFVQKQEIINNRSIELRIWDTAGQEVYRGLAPMYYRSAQIAIVVFDVTNRASYESVEFWVKELQKNANQIPCITICGNKIDVDEERIIPPAEAKKFAVENGAIYCEASAKDGTGISQLFQTSLAKMFEELQTKDTVNFNGNTVNLNEKSESKGCAC